MSFIIQPSAASNVFAATANGAITANKPCILNSDGTVSEVVYDPYSVSAAQPFNNPITWLPIDGLFCDIGNNNVALLVYDTTTGYPGIIVGTLSGTGNQTFTFGSVTTLTTARTYPGTVPTRMSSPRMIFDAVNNKLIVGWISGSNANLGQGVPLGNELDFIVSSVSGTTITPGSLTQFTGTTYGMFGGVALVWDTSKSRLVTFYQTAGVPSYNPELYYQIFSISGTTITRVTAESACGTGSSNRWYSSNNFAYEPVSDRIIGMTNDPASSNNKIIFSFSSTGSALTVTASSSRGNIAYTSVIPIVGFAAVLVAGDGSPFVQPFAIGASSITAGTGLTLSSLSGSSLPALSRTAAAGICFYTVPTTNTYGKAIVSMNASTVSVVSPSGVNNVQFGSGNPYGYLYRTYSSSAGRGIVIDRLGASAVQNAYVGNAIGSNLSSAVQFIGFASAAATNGASVNIATMGAQISGQSGLVLPNLYYVQTNGTLSTTPGSPSVLAGYALKSDTLLVKGTGT